MMRHDLVALGELVIDLVPVETPAGLAYLPKPGGAPANVAAGMARLGASSAMIGKVGAEPFGDAAAAALLATGVCTDAVVRSPAHNTALAVVAASPSGASDYIFYRENCADANLTADEVPLDLISASRILHVGTLLLATPLSAEAERHALAHARANKVLVSVDLNFRPAHWRGPARMREAGMEALRAANIAKASRDELMLLAGNADVAKAVRSLWHPGLKAFAVTKGADGADLFTQREAVSVSGFPIEATDTVGCGDAFMASLLRGLLELDGHEPTADALHTIVVRACAAGALIATRSGALESMPSQAEIDAFLSARR